MSKRLISEITRLHQLMGVKDNSLILESYGCPFCSSIIKQVDNFVDLMRRGGIDQIEFKLKVNELLDKLSKNNDLNLTEKTALSNVIRKVKEMELASNNVSKFREDLSFELFKRKEAFSDVINPESIIKRVIDQKAIMSDPKLVDDLFKNSPKIKETMTSLDDFISGPNFKTNLSKFKSVDEYAGKVEYVLKERFRADGFNGDLSDGLAKRFKNYIKARVELNPDLNPFISKIDEPINAKPIDIQNKIEEPNNDINIKVKSVGKELPPSRFHIGGTSIDNINTPGARPIGGSDPIIAKDRRGAIINNPYYSFVVEDIGDDVVYTFNRQDIQDAAGRGGNYSVSINYPKNSGVSLDDVKQILLNKSNEIFNKLKDAKAKGFGGADIGDVSTPTNAIPDGDSGVFTPTPEIPVLKR
jgi:hypothetical protein